MAIFKRAIEVDGEAWGECLFEADSPKDAIRSALEELRLIVTRTEELTCAIIIVGEDGSQTDTLWLGGWVWRESEGFVWLEPD